MNKNKFEVTVAMTQAEVVDLFISACQGGSNYWCKELTPKGRHRDVYQAMLAGFRLIDTTGNEDKKVDVTPAMIERGVQLFVAKEVRHYANFISDQWDAETADVFLQLCTFGEVIYG